MEMTSAHRGYAHKKRPSVRPSVLPSVGRAVGRFYRGASGTSSQHVRLSDDLVCLYVRREPLDRSGLDVSSRLCLQLFTDGRTDGRTDRQTEVATSSSPFIRLSALLQYRCISLIAVSSLDNMSAEADGPRDAASRPVDHRAVHRARTLSVINWRQSPVDVDSTRTHPPSTPGVRLFTPMRTVCL